MTTSSKPIVFAVLALLFLAVLPLQNPVPTVLEEQVSPMSSAGNFVDYELYMAAGGTFTTIEPQGNGQEGSLLGEGLSFQSNELLSDLTIKGESGQTIKINPFMKFESSDNTSTADLTFSLYSGSTFVKSITEEVNQRMSSII